MRVKELLIKNFKGIDELIVEPKEKLILAIGANGKGKTSFKEAFYAALTGNFPNDAIKLGHDYCELCLVLEDDTEITRIQYRDKKKPNLVKVNGKKTTNKAVAELFQTRTGLPMDIFEIVSSAEKLEELDSAELSTLMLAALSDKPDINVLLKYIGKISRKTEEALKEMFPAAPETFDFAKITEVYNLAKDERANYKRNCVNFKAAVEYGEVEEPKRTVAEVEADIHDVIRKESVLEEHKRTIRMYESAVASRQKILDTIKENETLISSIKAKRPVPSELSEINDAIAKTNSNIQSAKATIASLLKSNELFENTLENLGKAVCPISEKLICTTDKTAVRQDIQDIITSNKDAIKSQESLVEKFSAEIKALNDKLNAYNENVRNYDKVISLTANNERLKSSLPQLPTKPAEIKVFDYSLDKARLNKEMDLIKKYELYVKNLGFLEANQEMADIYDEIVNLLAPKGAVVKAITDHYLGVFSAAINETAAKLRPGFEIQFDTEKGFSLLVRTKAGDALKNFSMLSSGEKSLTMFMMLNLLNMIHNQRILFVDDIDKLDNDAFEQLLKIVNDKAFLDAYDHIVLLGVDHEDTMKLLSGVKADRI